MKMLLRTRKLGSRHRARDRRQTPDFGRGRLFAMFIQHETTVP